MYQYIKREVDPLKPYQPIYQGTLEKYVIVAGKKCRYLVYIPEGARESTSGVLVLGDDGKTADDLWMNSGWRELADSEDRKEKMIVFFLEPPNGKWNINEPYASLDGDVAYVDAVYYAACERFDFCVHESKFYLFGNGKGGTIAHMSAMYNPAVYAGVASTGASDVSSIYTRLCATDICTNLNGFIDENARQGRRKGDIPMPVYLAIDSDDIDDTTEIEQYWRTACKTASNSVVIDSETIEYRREMETEFPLNQDKEAYRVRVSRGKDVSTLYGKEMICKVWKEFLRCHRRWMSEPGGSLRVTQDPVIDLGMEYHFEEIDGWMREWYVYVPESVRQNTGLPVPLVFAMHGYTCSGEIYAGNSGWYKVAQERGFVLVHPTAVPGTLQMENQAVSAQNIPLPAWNFLHDTPNGPDEFKFFQTILHRVCAEYSIDRNRVYATGHSHGSIMTQALALGMPEVFAAVAPCSGVLFQMCSGGLSYNLLQQSEIKNSKRVPVPIWMLAGEQEPWLLPHLPENENDTEKSIRLWCLRNGLSDISIDQLKGRWQIYRDRWHDLICNNDDQVPMVRYTWVDYMPHATMPEMSYRIWDEFFSYFSRESGKIVYRD